MALFEEEYGWLRRLMDISNCLHKDSPYLIHRHDGQQHSKLNRLLLGAWVDAGMKGSINFNMVRSSVSSQVSVEPCIAFSTSGLSVKVDITYTKAL